MELSLLVLFIGLQFYTNGTIFLGAYLKLSHSHNEDLVFLYKSQAIVIANMTVVLLVEVLESDLSAPFRLFRLFAPGLSLSSVVLRAWLLATLLREATRVHGSLDRLPDAPIADFAGWIYLVGAFWLTIGAKFPEYIHPSSWVRLVLDAPPVVAGAYLVYAWHRGNQLKLHPSLLRSLARRPILPVASAIALLVGTIFLFDVGLFPSQTLLALCWFFSFVMLGRWNSYLARRLFSEALVDSRSRPSTRSKAEVYDSWGLTRREREVCDHIERGLILKEIGLELGISVNTVRNHSARVLSKAGVSNRTQLIRKILEEIF